MLIKQHDKFEKDGSRKVWVLGFILFLLFVIFLHAAFEVFVNGPESYVNILSFFGRVFFVPTSIYFLISMLVVAIVFAYFGSHIFGTMHNNHVFRMFEALKEEMENLEKRFKKDLDEKNAKFSLDQFMLAKEMKEIKKEIVNDWKKIGERFEGLKKVERSLEQHDIAVKDLQKKIDEIMSQMTSKSYLDASSDIKKIVGVGEKTAKALKSVGIEKVEDLIIEKPSSIAEKTGLSEAVIVKIQSTAMLLMIPGIRLETVKYLQKIGISSVEDLAKQIPLDLFRKIVYVAGKRKDRPSLEEIALNVKLAQLYAFGAADIPKVYVTPFFEKVVQP